ncbi:hypothetical protein OQZ33_17300 [Pedobacter sp. MC2016-05]|uniref:5-methylcytosine restriction system specificity protein McrC n=1 Tax=Pedobacter sp. MC2016-05 TaxID=2994474 RepID=UPI0022481967|nr:hypothetical protein [Pedobacter sp. MC2016-05]MCX2476094.1 hypothetical protein [Pedobacter sp. MC2016-05]
MSVHRIKEYGRIRSVTDFPDLRESDTDICIPGRSFESIWNYILESQAKDKEIEKAFKLSQRNGKRIIHTQNYVGLIETTEKETVEIYPKIFSSGVDASIEDCKNIFLKMIATLRKSPFINMQQASLEVRDNFPILELFIGSFIAEVEQLVLKGIKRDYIKTERNSGFLKGQLLFSKNLTINHTDQSKFYVRMTDYQTDIPQNRILRAAINKLEGITSSSSHRRRLSRLSGIFDMTGPIKGIKEDLDKCASQSRLFIAYERSLEWASVFLLGKSFTTFSGKQINQAMLFPMEILFESYIAYLFKKHATSHIIHTQHRKLFMVDKHKERGKFALKPDLYAEPTDDGEPSYVLDTKWKIIDENLENKNYLISQADMYQLYAYGRKYIKAEIDPKLILIYPASRNFSRQLEPFIYETRNGQDHLELIAFPFDLKFNHQLQIENILLQIGKEPAVAES